MILVEDPAPNVGALVRVNGKKPKGGHKRGKQEVEVGSTSKTANKQSQPKKGRKREHSEDKDQKESIAEVEVKKVKKLTNREEIMASYLKLVAVEGKDKVERELENLIKSDRKKTTGFVIHLMFTHLF